eukprot:TRINITY_DN23163_c0_g1_i1.p1 TRINITY_DN23163_c0_g1~~TRINITY_DN23163_c0_g1_i1.p1  ORF type:complete len:230 (+),score=40.45 TRINITY_DN23163_c0_g1_i1:90-779(+)
MSNSSAEEKWGTQFMGAPAAPSSHPQNQKAATWLAPEPNPYVAYAPSGKPPLETILDTFNELGRKAESLANNIWQHLKTGSSVSDAAWGKLSLGAKAMREGGFEALYKQTFSTHPDEKLKKTFACYLSTTTGPVAGTLYLSNLHVAFCSDRPLCFTAPSGQKIWTYYKAFIPLANIIAVNPITMRENPSERYIQLVTVDGHEFWFMGFVNYDKALAHLSESLSQLPASA